MSWWTTQLVFRDDTLVSEGVTPASVDDVEWVVQESGGKSPDGAERYTQVVVSGYALYGELRGYYALGVAHWYLDRANGCAFLSETSRRNSEPVSSLTPAQRAIIRECLIHLNPQAWETSNVQFRKQLEA
jgi:hypothetical protein